MQNVSKLEYVLHKKELTFSLRCTMVNADEIQRCRGCERLKPRSPIELQKYVPNWGKTSLNLPSLASTTQSESSAQSKSQKDENENPMKRKVGRPKKICIMKQIKEVSLDVKGFANKVQNSPETANLTLNLSKNQKKVASQHVLQGLFLGSNENIRRKVGRPKKNRSPDYPAFVVNSNLQPTAKVSGDGHTACPDQSAVFAHKNSASTSKFKIHSHKEHRTQASSGTGNESFGVQTAKKVKCKHQSKRGYYKSKKQSNADPGAALYRLRISVLMAEQINYQCHQTAFLQNLN